MVPRLSARPLQLPAASRTARSDASGSTGLRPIFGVSMRCDR
ncbi:MAG: hypothetical protein ACK56I_03010 [bacterium]